VLAWASRPSLFCRTEPNRVRRDAEHSTRDACSPRTGSASKYPRLRNISYIHPSPQALFRREKSRPVATRSIRVASVIQKETAAPLCLAWPGRKRPPSPCHEYELLISLTSKVGKSEVITGPLQRANLERCSVQRSRRRPSSFRLLTCDCTLLY
jgi:hypothetical protein